MSVFSFTEFLPTSGINDIRYTPTGGGFLTSRALTWPFVIDHSMRGYRCGSFVHELHVFRRRSARGPPANTVYTHDSEYPRMRQPSRRRIAVNASAVVNPSAAGFLTTQSLWFSRHSCKACLLGALSCLASVAVASRLRHFNHQVDVLSHTHRYKKLSYRRGTARCVVSVEILPIAKQQCRNYLYDKS